MIYGVRKNNIAAQLYCIRNQDLLMNMKGMNCSKLLFVLLWLSLEHASSAFITRQTNDGIPIRVRTTGGLFAKTGTKKKKVPDGTIAVNRIAYRNYEILDTLEAGISLTGTEIKSIRDGKLNLRDGFVKPTRNGRSCTLFNVHIGKCSQVGSFYQHEETRPRDLLVHKEQARKLLQQTEQQGMTIVPLKAYFSKENKVKLQIAVCRGKNVRDKRVAIQERDEKRESNRIIKNFII